MKLYIILLLGLFCALTISVAAQDSTKKILREAYLSTLSSKADSYSEKLDKTSAKAIQKLKKSEDKITRKLSRLDSTKAKEVFLSAESKYNTLKQKLQHPESFKGYIPYLDTLKTSIKFLQNNQELLGTAKEIDQKIGNTFSKVKELEGSLQKADEVKAFIRERKAYLKEQLSNFPFTKELKRINKQAYYYSAQISEYKEAFKDTKKLERKALQLLSKTKPFQDFMRKNSQLASMFRLPGGDDPMSANTALQGLQTRASVNAMIQDRIGTGAEAQAMFRENVRGAQGQLSDLKNKALKYGSGSVGNGSGDMEAPDFKPNTQKTKSLLKRLEYGGNVQSQSARAFFPVTSDLGLSLGYKLNDKSVIGVGGSYKLGWGKGWNNITMSHQGASLRSYVDYKIKGSIFFSGGYEQNYRTAFASIDQLKDKSRWQNSGLLGLSKKYSISKKLRGNVQLLWDFLSYQQIPRTQAVLFRVGYNIK